MVHALSEARRVLAPRGLLVDLRPLTEDWAIEIAGGGESRAAGRLIPLPAGRADDQAANRAIEEAAERGWFVNSQRATFPLFYYWDTPAEMQAFLEDEWEGVVELDEETGRRLRAAWASAEAAARIRVRITMLLAGWVRQGA
jgi:hypothetical protein